MTFYHLRLLIFFFRKNEQELLKTKLKPSIPVQNISNAKHKEDTYSRIYKPGHKTQLNKHSRHLNLQIVPKNVLRLTLFWKVVMLPTKCVELFNQFGDIYLSYLFSLKYQSSQFWKKSQTFLKPRSFIDYSLKINFLPIITVNLTTIKLTCSPRIVPKWHIYCINFTSTAETVN